MSFHNKSAHMLKLSLPSSSKRSPQELSPLSASAYFDQVLEVNPPDNDTTFRVYLSPPVPTKDSKYGTYLICHHGGGASALSFAALAKDVKSKSQGELGVLAYDCRGHGEALSAVAPSIPS